MASSGTYAYAPSIGELVINAFGRIGIRRTELTTQHLSDALTESNLLQVDFGNRIPNWWLAETYDISLLSGTPTYTLPSRLMAPVVVWLTVTPNGGTSFDRVLGAWSTYEYEAQTNKLTQGQPTTYWFSRTINPEVTLWPVPDDNATYTLHMRMMSQPQDAVITNGVQPDMPYRFLDAYTAALAYRLSVIYAQPMEDRRLADSERAWARAANNDTELVSTYIIPAIGGYSR